MNTQIHKNSLLDLLRSDFETVFNDSWMQPYYGNKNPLMNISEKEEEILVELAIPGFKKTDLEISIENSLLTVRGKKQAKSETEKTKYSKKEFLTQEFVRAFRIDPALNQESIASKLEDGILTINIPRTKKAESKKLISIF